MMAFWAAAAMVKIAQFKKLHPLNGRDADCGNTDRSPSRAAIVCAIAA
jgi:hypothetical protein